MSKMKALLILLLTTNVMALTLKVGVLTPEGTNWAKNLKKMAKAIKKETNGEVKVKFYFGGSQGDEPDVLRKIRVGQLHGGVFTAKTLGDINGDVRVVEIPFNFFHNRKKALKTLDDLTPFLNKKINESNFVNLGFFDIGMVYFVSKTKISSIDSLKGVKIWSWEGDPLVETILEEMKLVSVQLPLPDVLSSLSTGIIEAAYAPPLAILSMQWNTKVKYLIDFPLTMSVGAFLVNDKVFKKISPENQKKVLRISKKYIDLVKATNEKDNQDALDLMKASGVEFVKFSEADIKRGHEVREVTIKKLKGKLFSEEAYQRLEKSLKAQK
ncbi:ABC transporter, substrate-binding protein, family 7 [Bacteriovorax sp. BAL6_X]|uniref:TRAP transporter substrate-binding protein n=1 Tax=Bacteriovorax sp. BAL6_X TaxID=1201290 RepID=UPI00038673A6|nr:TRAP transporter substrate-binding protein DctP [Bacteriovorax sp. BAL6_X]EPZ49840.1 ABC transporter, substrate-binding protein, family 7 [Bacteriovorax sp. BAL6_X]